MKAEVSDRLDMRREPYRELLSGSTLLLGDPDYIYWTEKILLQIVRQISESRLRGLGGILPAEPEKEEQ